VRADHHGPNVATTFRCIWFAHRAPPATPEVKRRRPSGRAARPGPTVEIRSAIGGSARGRFMTVRRWGRWCHAGRRRRRGCGCCGCAGCRLSAGAACDRQHKYCGTTEQGDRRPRSRLHLILRYSIMILGKLSSRGDTPTGWGHWSHVHRESRASGSDRSWVPYAHINLTESQVTFGDYIGSKGSQLNDPQLSGPPLSASGG